MEHQHYNQHVTHHRYHRTEGINNEKLVAILSYFLIGIIWYFADETVQTKFTKFHVKQALNLTVITFIGSLAFLLIPVIGIWLRELFNLFMLILWIIALINLVNGKTEEVPIIGFLAESYLKF